MKRLDLNRLPDEAVSHNPSVIKRVLLRSGELGAVTQLAQATFPPGESVAEHSHLDMAEVFLVVRGEGTMGVDGTVYPLRPGVCMVVEPGERHQLQNTSSEPLVVTTLGLKL